jgi:hypothetical protein
MRARRDAVADLPPPRVEISDDQGFATVGSTPSIDTAAVVDDVRRRRKELSGGQLRDEKAYLLDHPVTDLAPSSTLLRFALDPEVVAAAALYLGIVPVLTQITILASPAIPGPLSGSQLFHSDWEDVRQVKVFVACSSVADENGPLTAISARVSRRVKDEVGYRYGGRAFRLPDERVAPLLTANDVTAFTGPAGSTTFIDTSSCLHYGSRVHPGAEERLVVQFQYLTPPAFDLVASRKGRPFALLPGKDVHERMVLGSVP